MELNVEQQTEQWLQERAKRIGASDVAAIMGISPWKTSYQLWQEKTGRLTKEDNPAMAFGRANEEHLRSLYEFENNTDVKPMVYISDEEPWAIASLDGVTSENVIVEIKTCNADVFNKAKTGEVPEYYRCQALWQLFCMPTGQYVDMFFAHQRETCTVRIDRDNKEIKRLVALAKSWYEEYLLTDEPPPLSERDYSVVNDKTALAKVERWLKAKNALEAATQAEKLARHDLLDETDDGNTIIGDVKLTKYYVGGYDYKKAAIDSGVDLEQYKKAEAPRWRISVMWL